MTRETPGRIPYSTETHELVWDVHHCPNCGDEARMGVMSLVARSKCGWVFVDLQKNGGWYASTDEFYRQHPDWDTT
jgi:hypothetical protein